MKARSVLIAAGFAQCALAVMAVGAAVVAVAVAAGCLAEGACGFWESERVE